MTGGLQKIYNELAIERLGLTERKFSHDYLGKSETYFSYLKSTGSAPSAAALLTLYGRFRHESRLCESSLPRARSAYQERILRDWIELYGKLASVVLNEAIVPLSIELGKNRLTQ
jgi:hypothetical protein